MLTELSYLYLFFLALVKCAAVTGIGFGMIVIYAGDKLANAKRLPAKIVHFPKAKPRPCRQWRSA